MARAQAIFESRGDATSLAFTLAARTRLERMDGRLSVARDQGELAVAQMEELFGDGRNLAEVAIELGAIEAELGDTSAALRWFDRGLTAAERGRLERSYLRPDQLEPLLATLFAEAGRGNTGAAFERAARAMQLPRGATFEKALRRMTARLAADDPDLRLVVRQLEDAQEREREARIARGRLRLEDPTAAAGRTEEDLSAQIEAAKAEISRLETRLQAQHPRYGALIVPKLTDLRRLSELLRPDEAVLRITTTRLASYALLIRSGAQPDGHRAPIGQDEMVRRVKHLREALTFTNGLRRFDVAAAATLGRDLLGPLNLADIGHLIVVVDGPLTSLPLEVLPLRSGPSADYDRVPWLGRDIALSYLPSLAGLETIRTSLTASRAQSPFLGIGDPRLGGRGGAERAARAALEACQTRETYDPALLNAMAALPETADELRSVASALGAPGDALRLGSQASESTVKALDLDRYKVISFATHGLLPGEFRCRGEPGLVLTPPRTATLENDGLLSASEIARLDLDAELVVLSACNTAGPDGSLGGEALSGLATAFTYAGSRRLLVSHWDVASVATVALMQRAFSAMGQGSAAAFREARRSLIADPRSAHPAFWAPFVLIGDGGTPVRLAAR